MDQKAYHWYQTTPAKLIGQLSYGGQRLECPLIERTPCFESFESVALYQECHS